METDLCCFPDGSISISTTIILQHIWKPTWQGFDKQKRKTSRIATKFFSSNADCATTEFEFEAKLLDLAKKSQRTLFGLVGLRSATNTDETAIWFAIPHNVENISVAIETDLVFFPVAFSVLLCRWNISHEHRGRQKKLHKRKEGRDSVILKGDLHVAVNTCALTSKWGRLFPNRATRSSQRSLRQKLEDLVRTLSECSPCSHRNRDAWNWIKLPPRLNWIKIPPKGDEKGGLLNAKPHWTCSLTPQSTPRAPVHNVPTTLHTWMGLKPNCNHSIIQNCWCEHNYSLPIYFAFWTLFLVRCDLGVHKGGCAWCGLGGSRIRPLAAVVLSSSSESHRLPLNPASEVHFDQFHVSDTICCFQLRRRPTSRRLTSASARWTWRGSRPPGGTPAASSPSPTEE